MTGNQLIDDYASELSARLPPPFVEELLDGLTETYRHKLTKETDELTAARATIADFGQPDAIVRGFIQHSPGRRLATVLVTTGPLVGLTWAAVLIKSRAWNWPIPVPGRIAFGLTLLFAIGMLLATVRNREQLRRSRATGERERSSSSQ